MIPSKVCQEIKTACLDIGSREITNSPFLVLRMEASIWRVMNPIRWWVMDNVEEAVGDGVRT